VYTEAPNGVHDKEDVNRTLMTRIIAGKTRKGSAPIRRHPRYPRSINKYTDVKRAPDVWSGDPRGGGCLPPRSSTHSLRFSGELLQQPPGLFVVFSIKPFSKPVIDSQERLPGFLYPALLLP
jgi:hypothetical protein